MHVTMVTLNAHVAMVTLTVHVTMVMITVHVSDVTMVTLTSRYHGNGDCQNRRCYSYNRVHNFKRLSAETSVANASVKQL